jgi:hypothetical protein
MQFVNPTPVYDRVYYKLYIKYFIVLRPIWKPRLPATVVIGLDGMIEVVTTDNYLLSYVHQLKLQNLYAAL